MDLSLGRATLLVVVATCILAATTTAANDFDNGTLEDNENRTTTTSTTNGTTPNSTSPSTSTDAELPVTHRPSEGVIQCPAVIRMPLDASHVPPNGTWLVRCPAKYYHVTMNVKVAENLTDCDRFLLVGAGHKVLKSGPALLMGRGDLARSLYIPTDTAYVHWESNTIDSVSAFQLNCECYRMLEDPISRIPMTTPLTPPAHESLAICLKNLDQETAKEFVSSGLVAKQFLQALENKTNTVCSKAKTVSAYMVGTVYVHLDCKHSDYRLPSAQRLCVCFNISILLEGDSTCGDLAAPKALPQDLLERILKNMDLEVVVNANRTIEVQLLDRHFPLELVLVPIGLCGLTVLFFVLVWWGKDKLEEKTPSLRKKEDEMPVQMFPATMENPIYQQRESQAYLDENVTYNPYFDDSKPLSTVEEDEENTRTGLDNPGFSYDDEVPSSPRPLSPSPGRSFPTSPPTRPRLYPNMETLELRSLPTLVSSPVINDFSRATRYNQETVFSPKKSSIPSLKGSPKTTPTSPRRVGFRTPSPTLSRSSVTNNEDPEEHIYEEVGYIEMEDSEDTEL